MKYVLFNEQRPIYEKTFLAYEEMAYLLRRLKLTSIDVNNPIMVWIDEYNADYYWGYNHINW